MISLNPNEMEALRILWDRGELKPAEIQAQFSWEIDNGTLRSTLVNLVHKKHAFRHRQGKAFYYAARVPRTTALQAMTQGLARIFTGGCTRQLAVQLIDTTDVTADDLKLIRATAAAKPVRKQK